MAMNETTPVKAKAEGDKRAPVSVPAEVWDLVGDLVLEAATASLDPDGWPKTNYGQIRHIMALHDRCKAITDTKWFKAWDDAQPYVGRKF